MKRLSDDLKDLLDDSGVEWRVENGGRHMKLIVGGRIAAILPMGGRTGHSKRSHKNALAQVRRAISAQGGQS